MIDNTKLISFMRAPPTPPITNIANSKTRTIFTRVSRKLRLFFCVARDEYAIKQDQLFQNAFSKLSDQTGRLKYRR
ncbi:Uncharacterised protein [Chlamydia trachomatis]|nr:Uncharacterised protein [Chlamydia trachomatis]